MAQIPSGRCLRHFAEKGIDMTKAEKIGSVLVVGGGIGGIQSSLDLAEAGYKVYLVETSAAIGGRMAKLDKTFPTNDCAMCIISPKLVDCGRHLNIDILSYSDVIEVNGQAGNFKVKVLRKARYIDEEKCTGCGDCAMVCPVELPSKFDENICTRKAIYKLYPQATPNVFVIDKQDRPPCNLNCPAGTNIQAYMALGAQEKFIESYNVIRRTIPIPAVCGRICDHPCEDSCNRKDIDEAVSVNQVKRYVCDYVYQHESENIVPEAVETIYKEKIAVIGAGPAGLTCAYDLRGKGYSVTIFESGDKPGGMLRSAILDFRLPKNILQFEIENLLKTGIELKTGRKLGSDFSISDLKEKGYDSICLALGAQNSRKLNIAGEELANVRGGLEFLKEVNLKGDVTLKGSALVIGGGNVAIDTARAALRCGSSKVMVVCLEEYGEMPSHIWELKEAEKEGIEIINAYGPAEIKQNSDKAQGVVFKKCVSVFDGDGNFNPDFDEKQKIQIDCDNIFISIGQAIDTSFIEDGDGIEVFGDGRIKVNNMTLQTTREHVFSCGDVVTGPASCVAAIGAGHLAAESIHRYLRGENLEKDRDVKYESAQIPDRQYTKTPRSQIQKLRIEDRISNFDEVELTISRHDAVAEAQRCLSCGNCCLCLQCEEVCEANAINHDMQSKIEEINVGAILLTTGCDTFEAKTKGEYGYGRYKNVVTSTEFERILSASGPFEGTVLRPSDLKTPKKIAFLQCVGSRDTKGGNAYCSSVCCMYTAKESIIAKEHDPDLDVTVFTMDVRAYGKEFEKYYQRAKEQYGVKYVKCMISRLMEVPEDNNLLIKYVDVKGDIIEEKFDMVVLATGLVPSADSVRLAEIMGVERNEYDFIKTETFTPARTTAQGIFVGGAAKEPCDIPQTVVEASAAATGAAVLLSGVRWTHTKTKTYPDEIDVTEQDERIGVYICRCGRNIANVVDIEKVVEEAKKIENVVLAREALYTCSQDNLEKTKKEIEEYHLNRVVVASCTPRTHESLFRDTIREAGLNRFLFEMTNIRDQCSWVHMDFPAEATQKAIELVKMAVSKVRLLKPVEIKSVDINKSALVVGGGISGMTAAISMANQGFSVHLIEKQSELGGQASRIFYNLQGDDIAEKLGDMIHQVNNNNNVKVYLDTEIIENSGYTGNLKTKVKNKDNQIIEIEHGILTVATGAVEHKPSSYLYGKNDKVLTQTELEERIHNNIFDDNVKNVVMIQCVESRDQEHPYCSRLCCSNAIKNALKIKELNSNINVYVLFRDIRTYGFREKYYLQAREAGVKFISYDKDKKPTVDDKDGRLTVRIYEPFLGEQVTIPADIVVLSTGISPAVTNVELSKVLKLPLTDDGFFLEAHVKLRPLDFSKEGFYLCGLAHSPAFIDESIMQGLGASIRAATLLAKDKIEAGGIVAAVNELACRGCGICIDACPYDARTIDDEIRIAVVNEVLCQGCGACVVACPSRASYQKGFETEQIFAMIEQIK